MTPMREKEANPTEPSVRAYVDADHDELAPTEIGLGPVQAWLLSESERWFAEALRIQREYLATAFCIPGNRTTNDNPPWEAVAPCSAVEPLNGDTGLRLITGDGAGQSAVVKLLRVDGQLTWQPVDEAPAD